MAITAAIVKELRERTDAPMMECKKYLIETNGDVEKAIELMRKSGAAKAAKKEGRITAEGIILVATSEDKKVGVVIEINSETDFVARSDHFKQFASNILAIALANRTSSVEALLAVATENGTVDELRQALIAKIGENINIRRVELIESEYEVAHYSHGDRIGVLVNFKGAENLGKDIAMHIAASNPQVVAPEQVSEDVINKEKEIYISQAAESGKPQDIIEKMVVGRINKFLNEISLEGQPFVKDPDTTVGKWLKTNNAEVFAFSRFEVGEGIEKKEDNFVDEVLAQARGE